MTKDVIANEIHISSPTASLGYYLDPLNVVFQLQLASKYDPNITNQLKSHVLNGQGVDKL